MVWISGGWGSLGAILEADSGRRKEIITGTMSPHRHEYMEFSAKGEEIAFVRDTGAFDSNSIEVQLEEGRKTLW